MLDRRFEQAAPHADGYDHDDRDRRPTHPEGRPQAYLQVVPQPYAYHEPAARRDAYAADLHTTRAKYLKDWRIVKAARFNAAKRLERKQTASLLAFALAGTAGFVVPFFTLLFAERLAPHTKNVLDFAAYVSGALSLTIGLVEQAKNYPALAQRFHKCGLAVNSVLRRLRNTPDPDPALLDQLSKEYEQALHECEANHDDLDQAIAHSKLDLELAQRQGSLKPHLSERRVEQIERKLTLLKAQELAQIYWLYTLVWLGPSVLALISWITLSP